MEHFLTRSIDLKYQFEDESEYYASENASNEDMVFHDGASSSDSMDVEAKAINDSQELSVLKGPSLTQSQIDKFGETERANATANKLMENTMSLAANVTEL